MKEYRLAAWPDLDVSYDRTPYRRMLNDMSHRFVSLSRLVEISGLARSEVRAFIQLLDSRGHLWSREARSAAKDSVFGSLRPLGSWVRRALAPLSQQR